MNHHFMEALETLLRPHTTLDEPLTSLRAQGKFLGVSAPQLSRLKNGLVALTERLARQFSHKLATATCDSDAIYSELMRYSSDRYDDRFDAVMAAIRLQIPLDEPYDFGDTF